MTKVYIGDVTDHLESITSSMDQFVATCDHLTDYVFVSSQDHYSSPHPPPPPELPRLVAYHIHCLIYWAGWNI